MRSNLLLIRGLLTPIAPQEEGHTQYELVYCMLLGIRTMIEASASWRGASSAPVQDLLRSSSRLTDADFQEKKVVMIPPAGGAETPAHGYSEFKFKTFAPEAFRVVRKLCGIDEQCVFLSCNSLWSDFVKQATEEP